MTLTTLIIVNTILAAAVVYGVVMLLTHGIRSDRLRHLEAEIRQLGHRERDRIAA